MPAQPAYLYDYASPAHQRTQREQRELGVLEGARSANAVSSGLVFAAKAVLVLAIMIALVACVRVGLAAAAVSTNVETERMESQIQAIRSGSADLEVRESMLANPAAIKEAGAKQLGMAAPEEVAVITLAPDVVAYNASGSLSLSKSLAIGALG